MGNTKSKKPKVPQNFFENERNKQLENERKKREQPRTSVGRQREEVAPARPPRPENVPIQKEVRANTSYEEDALKRMRNQMKSDADAFLLNNIMMSVQFFENYERVLFDLKNNSVTDCDVMLNNNMAQHHKHVLMPDKLQEAVHTNVQFRGTKVGTWAPTEALQPQRMFVVHDNIEVNAPGEIDDYSTVLDTPYYRMQMEESSETGYVKLNRLEILESNTNREASLKKINNRQNNYSDSDSDAGSSGSETIEVEEKKIVPTEGENFMNAFKKKIEGIESASSSSTQTKIDKEIADSEESGEFESGRRLSGILKPTNRAVVKGKLVHAQIPKPKTVRHKVPEKKLSPPLKKVSPTESESSGYKSSYSLQAESSGNESDYGYATITAETTPRKLEKSLVAKLSDSTSVIPLRCISLVEVKVMPGEDDDDIDEAYNIRHGTNTPNELYKKLYYLNSIHFMINFSDLFLMKLAEPLGFPPNAVKDASTQGASIYCQLEKGARMTLFEILPSVNSSWPNAAEEWMIRERNIITNPRTNYKYQWPTSYIVNKARGFGCLLVPLGFRPTRGKNKEQRLQWRIMFPAVERYLETGLAHSQVRCYLFTVSLFKTFMKNDFSKAGLDYSHVRNHLFWQCEDNYAKWPEDRLGETLLIFLKSFYKYIMKRKMADYFIPKCNMLKGIPTSVLLKQQRVVADIIQAPVTHLLSTLRKLKYVKPNFYPVLNYQELYRILTTSDVMRMVNPNLPLLTNDYDEDEDSDHEEVKGVGFWDEIKAKDPGYKWSKQKAQMLQAKQAEETLIQNQKKKKKSNRKIILPSFLEPNRRRLVLELFIPHFIAMGDCSDRFESTRQALIYMEHAQRLSILLREEPGGEIQAKEYIDTTKQKIDILVKTFAKSGGPKVPKRNESFNGTTARPSLSGLKNVKMEQYVNLESVKSQDVFVRTPPASPNIRKANVILADVHSEVEKPKPYRAISFQRVEEESEDEESEKEDSDDDITESKL